MLGIWRQGSGSSTKPGESDDFKQELDYIMGTLLDTKSPMNLKYLSVIQLAKKCVSVEFRRFLRAQLSSLNKILQAMNDLIAQGPAMVLAISTILYFLAKDHKSIPVTEVTLHLAADLMKQQEQTASKWTDAEYRKQVKVVGGSVKRCKRDWQENSAEKSSRGITQSDLSEETLSPASLMLEALAYMSSNEHSALFKTELLSSGCLQWVVAKLDRAVLTFSHTSSTTNASPAIDTSEACQSKAASPAHLASLKEVERCLRILENAAAFDKKNQAYLISHRNGLLLFTCAKFLNCFQKAGATLATKSNKNGTSAANSASPMHLLDCVCVLARVLMNLSHENELCAMKLGQIAGFLANCIATISLAPRIADKDRFFDVSVMMYGLLVNMVEKCSANRRKLLGLKMTIYDEKSNEPLEAPVLEALTKMFIKHDNAARDLDEQLDNELAFEEEGDDGEEGEGGGEEGARTSGDSGNNGRTAEIKLSEDEIFNAVQGAMNKASAHMEDSMIASYLALLIGCLIQNDETVAREVKNQFPDKDMKAMIEQLQRFLEFMTLTKLKSGATRSIERIVQSLQTADGT